MIAVCESVEANQLSKPLLKTPRVVPIEVELVNYSIKLLRHN